ncbi:hypothetical protein [Trebonia sp.]|uniref:hypothetical protein n=1 Tax=Trebonia sp. TaxID=2767075 RepID=UPI003BB10A54
MRRQSARALRTTCHRDKLPLWLAEDTLLLVDAGPLRSRRAHGSRTRQQHDLAVERARHRAAGYRSWE